MISNQTIVSCAILLAFFGVIKSTLSEKCSNGIGDLDTVANPNVTGDQIPTIVLYDNVPIKEYIDKGQRKRYSIPLPESSPISIVITPTQEIHWRLVFNNTLVLANFTSSDNRAYALSCASAGEYDIFIVAMERTHIRVDFNIPQQQQQQQLPNNWKLDTSYAAASVKQSDSTGNSGRILTPSADIETVGLVTDTTKIRFQYQPKRLQVLLKWEKSTSIFEPDSINYCLSINVHKSMHNLCQAFGSVAKKSCPQFDLNTLLKSTKQDDIKKVDISKGNVLCTGFKTQQMLRGMRPNTMYFLDLFAIHTKQNNFTFRLDSQQVWFNRSRPVPLVEGKWATSELASLGGFAVFSYKVPVRATIHDIQLFVVPCNNGNNDGTTANRGVDIKVLRDKKLVENFEDIVKPQLIRLNSTQPGERYIIRVMDTNYGRNKNENSFGDSNGSGNTNWPTLVATSSFSGEGVGSNEDESSGIARVEMTITTKRWFTNLPRPPTNLTVVELDEFHTCNATVIAWNSTLDNRDVKYRIFVLREYTDSDLSMLQTYNYCLVNSRLTNHPQFHKAYCTPGKPTEIQKFSITGLSPSTRYLIYVAASLGNDKSLPYEVLQIKTRASCKQHVKHHRLSDKYGIDGVNWLERKNMIEDD